MSVENFIEAQKRRIERNLYEAAVELHLDMTERIFEQNKDINGNSPRPYDTKPVTLSRKSIPREAGKKTKTGLSRKFEGGYAEMKKAVGEPPIRLFGVLENSWNNSLRQNNPYEFTFSVPFEDAQKIKGNFKQFFRYSQSELEKFKLNVIKND